MVLLLLGSTFSVLATPAQAVAPAPPSNSLLGDDTSTIEGSIGQWVPWFSSAVSRTTAQALEGTHSLRVDVTALYGWGVQLHNWPGFPADPGPMWISFWGRLGSGTDLGAWMTVGWHGADRELLRSDRISIPALTADWQQASAGVIAPPGTTSVNVDITHPSGGPGDTVYFDDIVVSPLSSVLDADTSTLEGSIGHWVPWFSDTVARSTVSHGGGFGLHVDITALYGWGVQLDNWPGFSTGPGPKTIAFAGRLGSGTDLGATMAVDWRDAAGAVLRTDTVTIGALDPSTWQRASADVTAPPDTAWASVEFSHPSGGPGDSLDLDDVVVADR
jgi:hypothetical protein